MQKGFPIENWRVLKLPAKPSPYRMLVSRDDHTTPVDVHAGFSDDSVDFSAVLPGNRLMSWTDREITAWLDERLPANRMAEFEMQLRADETLRSRVAGIIRGRDQGGNTVGEIWQRSHLSCPARTELGGYLLNTLSDNAAQYVEFHLMTVGCRVCQANLADLEEQSGAATAAPSRRRRFFESSAGLLRNSGDAGPFLKDQ
jgi:hypothetical protein